MKSNEPPTGPCPWQIVAKRLAERTGIRLTGNRVRQIGNAAQRKIKRALMELEMGEK